MIAHANEILMKDTAGYSSKLHIYTVEFVLHVVFLPKTV